MIQWPLPVPAVSLGWAFSEEARHGQSFTFQASSLFHLRAIVSENFAAPWIHVVFALTLEVTAEG